MIYRDVPLKKYNTFALDYMADCMIQVKNGTTGWKNIINQLMESGLSIIRSFPANRVSHTMMQLKRLCVSGGLTVKSKESMMNIIFSGSPHEDRAADGRS